MHTNVYTAERNATAQYAAELHRAQHRQLVRQAKAHHQHDHCAHARSSAGWFERVMTVIKQVWAGTREGAAPTVQ